MQSFEQFFISVNLPNSLYYIDMAQSYTKRSDGSQLPSAAELLDILKKESQRKAIRFDFPQKNTSVFNAHRKLSRLAGADDSWIDNYQALDLAPLVAKIDENHTKIAQYIPEHPEANVLYQAFYNALTPPDDLTPTEALFVFGASSNARVERAAELYKQNVANKIILSGKSPHYVDSILSEAQRMAVAAIEAGVPEASLTLEHESITLPDNVKRSIDMMESLNWYPTSLTLIATNCVLTRAKMEWYKFCPWDIAIHTVAARPQSAAFTAGGWSKDSNTIALVLNEYAKLVLESKVDLMRRDGEID